MNMEVGSNVGGRYRVEVHDSITGLCKEDTGWFSNLITNQGLDKIGILSTGTEHVSYCMVGSGSASPVATDVGLQSPITGSKSIDDATKTFTQLPNNIRKFSTVYRYSFAAGALVGTIREITVGWTYANNVSAFSRSLLKDASGNPIEVAVTSSDLVTIYYELSVYVTTQDTVSTVTIGGIDYTLTVRPVSVNNYGEYYWYPAAVVGYGAGRGLDYVTAANIANMTWDSVSSINYSSTGASTTVSPYVNGAYSRTLTLNITNGFEVNVRALFLAGTYSLTGAWAFIFSSDIPKAANQKLDISVKFKWGRYVA